MHQATSINRTDSPCQRSRAAFTLVELIVVIIVLGIIAAVAAPRMFFTVTDARDGSMRKRLRLVRDAIDLYRAEHRALPGDAGTQHDFKADLKGYLKRFPRNPHKDGSKVVKVYTAGTPLSNVGGSAGWLYDNVKGEFIANSNGIHVKTGRSHDEL